jgi:hypothetical protein
MMACLVLGVHQRSRRGNEVLANCVRVREGRTPTGAGVGPERRPIWCLPGLSRPAEGAMGGVG